MDTPLDLDSSAHLDPSHLGPSHPDPCHPDPSRPDPSHADPSRLDLGHLDPSRLDLDSLARRYRDGAACPSDVAEEVLRRISARGDDHVWITPRPAAVLLADAAELARRWPDPGSRPPLYGVPFAVKDNVDVAGLPTTAACPAYAYVPERSAPLVDRLLAAGALLVGKTNLDQFATGLSGTRSPYGVCESPLVPGLISGGSSSGSAVAVAAGLVAFAIGTDTAGSGRVPAALTGTVGIKPSRGLVSTLGLVPACASLDCPSVFARSVADGAAVLSVIAGYEPADPWSRPLPVPSPEPPVVGALRIGVPQRPEFYGDDAAAAGFEEAVERLAGLGHQLVPVDLDPFLAAGRLLYEGPWIAERLAAVGEFAARNPDEVHPVTRKVLSNGTGLSAVDAFQGLYKLRALRAETRQAWESMDALVVPTVPTTYTIAEMVESPIDRNTVLGHYTTFTNLLDLAGVSVPAGTTSAGRPHGITLLGPAGSDELLAALAAPFHPYTGSHTYTGSPAVQAEGEGRSVLPVRPGGIADPRAVLAVVGAHRAGQPLHGQLTSLGAVDLGTAQTAPLYRLYALSGGEPPRPGLVRSVDGGVSVEVELYALSPSALGTLLTQIMPPLSLGWISLADGRQVHGFLCESYATEEAADISKYGSWPDYLLSPERGAR
ncbi:allophanate hydrolase [Sphaerisporangium sp. NBC_01403]|uniref:allophanate hydrolase n=1 Tax=Sphaerisporangium sp. NBC_01403 TaxID=2903599 RepID=UPI0032474B4E